MPKMTAATRYDRIKELEQKREELTCSLNQLKNDIDYCANHKLSLQQKLDEMTGNPGRYGRPAAPRPGEVESLKADIADLDTRKRDLQEQIAPVQSELEQLTKELHNLEQNRQQVTLADLKKAGGAIAKTEAEIDRIYQASDDAAAKVPRDQIEKLKTEIEEAAADRDLLAADVDFGEGSEAELKKATTRLSKLEKQLADLAEHANLSEATARGYTRRLDRLTGEKQVAEKELACMLSLYAAEIHSAEVERLRSAVHEMQSALTGMEAANQLSERNGDGTPLSNSLSRFSVRLPDIAGLGNTSVGVDQESVSERVTETLNAIGFDSITAAE